MAYNTPIGINGIKTITSGIATDLFEVAIPAGGMVGGTAQIFIQATDGTDFQAISNLVTFAGVNKAGTLSAPTPLLIGNPAYAESLLISTLVNFYGVVTGTNKITIRMTTTSSLVGAVLKATMNIVVQGTEGAGAVTIL